MIEILIALALIAAAVWIVVRLLLLGPDLAGFDNPAGSLFGDRTEASAENANVLNGLKALNARIKSVPYRQQLAELRRAMDEGILGAPVSPEQLGVRVEPVSADDVSGEWVLAPGADPSRRLLYVHGGGFVVGSPASARMLTAAFSKLCGIAVLSVDYRLMPEHRRIDTISDCQCAYRWMLANGPEGAGDASELYVAGDSAGGSLALMLAAWARDTGTRPMNAVIALSPTTDSTLANPSMRTNIRTDALLGPSVGLLAQLPTTIRLLLGLAIARMNPRNPLLSPLLGDLGGLPPILVQASDCEMLLDDSRRYVNKACSQGSPATLQLWPGMVHVFQMYGHLLPESAEALQEAARFVRECSTARRAAEHEEADRQ